MYKHNGCSTAIANYLFFINSNQIKGLNLKKSLTFAYASCFSRVTHCKTRLNNWHDTRD